MKFDAGFLENEILALDHQIEKGLDIIRLIESKKIASQPNDLAVVQAKLEDWIQKRDLLVKLLAKQIKARNQR